MIENDEQLEATFQALGCLYRGLAALRKGPAAGTRQYGLFAEGPLDEIAKLQSEIHAYLGISDPASSTEPSPARKAEPVLREEKSPYGSPNKPQERPRRRKP